MHDLHKTEDPKDYIKAEHLVQKIEWYTDFR